VNQCPFPDNAIPPNLPDSFQQNRVKLDTEEGTGEGLPLTSESSGVDAEKLSAKYTEWMAEFDRVPFPTENLTRSLPLI